MRAPQVIRFLAAPTAAVLVAALGLSGWATLGRAHARVGAGPEAQETPRESPPVSTPGPGDAAARGLTEGEKAILALDEAFVRSYNQGDSKALAAMFAEDAEVAEADGGRQQGRDRIERRLGDTFASNPGARIAIETDAIRFLSPDVAKEEGRSLVTPAVGPSEELTFTVLYVRRDGRWLISSLREDPIEAPRPHDRLKDLEWMVGEWVEEHADSAVRFSCRWAEGGNFLLRDVAVKRGGRPVMSIAQRIGWDPSTRQVRSWEFDSAGGFGEGRWSRAGDRWTIKHSGIQADGTASSATNIMTKQGPDAGRWVSTDRVVGGGSLPDSEGDVLVRVPPAPRVESQGRTTPAKSPGTTRRQR